MKTLEAKKRDLTVSLDFIRKNDVVPAIVYQKGMENIPISVMENKVRSLWRDLKDENPCILDIEGELYTVILKDIQVHVVSGKILHIDFLVQL